MSPVWIALIAAALVLLIALFWWIRTANGFKRKEIKISEAFGGINYWHSCGNTTPFLKEINSIPNLTMVHVSPWTNVWEAVKTYDQTKVLEIAINPLDDVLTPEYPEKIDEKIIEIKEATREYNSVCRSDGFMVIDGDINGTIKKLQYWIDRANEILL